MGKRIIGCRRPRVGLSSGVARKPKTVRKIHFTGACGRAIGPLALELKLRGWAITASDRTRYAPMDKVLAEGGLDIIPRFAAKNVPPGTDLVVVGSQIKRTNAEWAAARRLGIPVLNMARFLGEELAARSTRLVVAGTKGKTTTTAMLAWILKRAGLKPDYLIGGLCPHFPMPFRCRGARHIVLEGDEYPSSREDPTPKFRHYRPDVLVVTNIEHDHAEVYPSVEEIRTEFKAATAALPAGGALIVSHDCPNAAAIAASCPVEIESVGWGRGALFRLTGFQATARSMRFRFCGRDFQMKHPGRMLALDAALAARAAMRAGISLDESARALSEFEGVRGRLQVLLDEPIGTVVHDESHHPSAIRENIAALRLRFPGRRLVVMLQPRNTGGRGGFQEQALPDVLAAADSVILLRPFDLDKFPAGPFSSHLLAARLRKRGVPVCVLPKGRNFPVYCARTHEGGDVLYVSVPAGFEIHTDPLLAALRSRRP